MENKINIAELLKDCPKGMELDCIMYDNVVFEKLDVSSSHHPIILRRRTGSIDKYSRTVHLTKYGRDSDDEDCKCLIFPKGKTTWEGFVPPCKFKDGDIVATDSGSFIGIIKVKDNKQVGTYCAIDYREYFRINPDYVFGRLATEKEKVKLFQAIKDSGYKWNPETKTLDNLPKFKVGDKIVKKNSGCVPFVITGVSDDYYSSNTGKYVEILPVADQDDWELYKDDIKPKFKVGDKIRCKAEPVFVFTITNITEDKYECGKSFVLRFSNQDKYELVPNKFDINTLKPFDKVLVRIDNSDIWECNFFSSYNPNHSNRFHCIGAWYNICIPYIGNEHLLGTTQDCDEFYKL